MCVCCCCFKAHCNKRQRTQNQGKRKKGKKEKKRKMSDKGEYEAIPDVEEGGATTAVETPSARKVYPANASPEESNILMALDDGIINAEPRVVLSKMGPSDVSDDVYSAAMELCRLLVFPTMMLFVLIAIVLLASFVPLGGGRSGIDEENTTIEKAFPYVACVLLFLSILPATSAHFNKRKESVRSMMTKSRQEAVEKIEALSARAAGCVVSAEIKMEKALEPMKGTIDRAANELDDVLRASDPNIEYPDPKDVESGFEGLNLAIHEAVDESRTAIDELEPDLGFDKGPYLVVTFVLQIVVAHFIPHLVEFIEPYYYSTLNLPDDKINWNLATTALLLYLSFVIQMIITVLFTRVDDVVAAGNRAAQFIEIAANHILESKAWGPFRDVFGAKFGTIKTKLTALMTRVEKLKGRIRVADTILSASKSDLNVDGLEEEAGDDDDGDGGDDGGDDDDDDDDTGADDKGKGKSSRSKRKSFMQRIGLA